MFARGGRLCLIEQRWAKLVILMDLINIIAGFLAQALFVHSSTRVWHRPHLTDIAGAASVPSDERVLLRALVARALGYQTSRAPGPADLSHKSRVPGTNPNAWLCGFNSSKVAWIWEKGLGPGEEQDLLKKWGSYISQLDQKGFSDSLGDVPIYLVEKLISHPSVD